jgi:hypothetical protein
MVQEQSWMYILNISFIFFSVMPFSQPESETQREFKGARQEKERRKKNSYGFTHWRAMANK